MIGKVVHLDISRIISLNLSGPREQFEPSADTPSPSIVIAKELISVPVNVLPFSSNVIVQITGRSLCSFAASTDALIS